MLREAVRRAASSGSVTGCYESPMAPAVEPVVEAAALVRRQSAVVAADQQLAEAAASAPAVAMRAEAELQSAEVGVPRRTDTAPDAGRAKVAIRFAEMIDASFAIMHKMRPEHERAEITEVTGRVQRAAKQRAAEVEERRREGRRERGREEKM